MLHRALRPLVYLALFSVLLSQSLPTPPAQAAMMPSAATPAVSEPQRASVPGANQAAPIPHIAADVPAANPAPTPAPTPAPLRTPGFGPFPLAFVANAGQSDSAVRYLVRSRGGTFFFNASEAVVAVPVLDPNAPSVERGRRHGPQARVAGTSAVRLQYQGVNSARELHAGERLLGVVNYLLGTNRSKWLTNLPTYDSLSYVQLYTGIDLRYEGVDGQLKRTYLVAAGANPANIRWRYTGATDVHLDAASGDLLITLPPPAAGLPGATLTERAPLAWQEIGGRRVGVEVRFVLAPNGSVGFALGAYDHSQPLTIDPVLSYSTYLGGSGNDEGNAITVDSSGNAYVAGGTFSSNFPTAGPLQGSRAGSEDVFISKVSADGTTLLYSTYLGGSREDEGNAIALDASGNIIIAGESQSTNYPTQNPLDGTYGGGTCNGDPCEDAIVTKLNAAGSAILYSTYMGGNGTDEGQGVAVDSSGYIYATGFITSTSGLTMTNAYDSSFNGVSDALLVKLNPALSGNSSLLYSTYLGGGDEDLGNAIAVGSGGIVTIAGETSSRSTTPFPTKNAYQSTKGSGSSSDAFVTRLNTTLSGNNSLLYSSYLGGSSYDKGLGLSLDSTSGYVYITGYTQSTNFPTLTPLQASRAGDKDAFVAAFNPGASGNASLLYSSYLGGTLEDRGFGIARDSAGVLYLSGLTRSSNFPTASPIQSSIGGGTCGTVTCTDVFVTQFDLATNSLGWSTYLGGNNDDEGDAIAVVSSSAAYITGITSSSNFPTTAGARQGTYGGGSRDAFVAKIATSTAAATATLTLAPASAGPNVLGTQQLMQATLLNQYGAPIANTSVLFTVSGPNATTGSRTTTISGTASFTYTGTVTGTDTVQASATVNGAPVTSNQAHVGWITPLKDIATTTVWARFFTNPTGSIVFDKQPTDTPAFTQTFPTLNFNPVSGSVPGSPINQDTRPFTNVTTDQNGNYTGSIVAQGNGYVAGTGTLAGLEAVFSGKFVVKNASTLTLSIYSDDGFSWGVGPDEQGHQPTGSVSGGGYTPFFHFPILNTNNGAWGFSTISITFPAAGVYPYEIDWAENGGGGLSFSVLTASNNQGVPPSGALTLSPSSTSNQPTGQTQNFTALAVDAAGAGLPNQPVVLTVTGANPQQLSATTSITGLATFSYSGANVGEDTVQAITWVSGIAVYSGQVKKTWTPGTAPGSGDPLAVPGQIGSPANGSVISDTVPIVLAPGLPSQTCTVDYWPANNPSTVTVLATGVAGSGGSTLANLDTTTLGNGSYVIRVRCTDGSGTQVQSGVLVTVVGENKPGRVRFSVTDLTVPVTGLPITIGRTYDSLEKSRSGDFGYGWSLSIGSPRLEVNQAHDVTVMQPNGQRVTFFFRPRSYGGVLGFFLQPSYTPEAGVYGSLSADGCPLLVAAGGGYVCFLDGAYQPTTYTYTDPYGRVFVMGADGKLQSITDLNQNKLTFGANGISSSAGGRSVAFVRDGQGRISQITDPAGKSYTYVYSATGDLANVTLPGVATPIKYSYDTSHLIKSIIDPRGHTVSTATYYPDGRLQDVTDAVGNKTSYRYNLLTNTTVITYPDDGVYRQVTDGYGSILSATDPLTRTTIFSYDSNHNLKTRTNALGHIATNIYDSKGNLTSVTNGAFGAASRTDYNQYGGPTILTDTIGVTRTIGYYPNFMPKNIKDRLGTRASFSFDSHGSLKTLSNGNGKTTSYTYDPYGNELTETDPLSHTTTFTYDQMGRRLSRTDALTNTTRYQYDALGHTVAITDAGNFVTKYTYDAEGNLASETDGRNNTTTYIYDNANRLQNIHFPDTSAITYTYDFRGNKLTETDQLGHVTKYVYDKAGQLRSVISAFGTPDASTVSYDYDAIGQRISATDALSHTTTTTYVYDALHHTKVLTETAPSPLSYLTTTFFNAAGQRIRFVDANNHKTSYQYDARGALTLTTHPDSTTSQQSYYSDGSVHTRTDQAGKITTYTYYDDGQLKTVTNPANETTTYGYDWVGNMTSIQDAKSHTTSFQYNGLHQRTRQTLPITSIFATYTYDENGNLHTLTDFNGKTTTYTYDKLNRITNIAPDASLSGQTPIGFTYYSTGDRKTMTDASGTTSYSYNARNRLLSKATPYGSLSYTYDAASNLRSMRSSNTSGITVTYSYDALNQLQSVVDNRLSPSANTTTYVYSPTSTLKSVTLPNGVVTSYGYDTLDRLTSLVTKKNTTTLGSFTYTLRPEGNRSQVVELGGRTVNYSYDNAYRVLTETISLATPSGTIGYHYDAVGNRTNRTSTVAGIAGASYTYDNNDRLNGNTYDNNGNTTVAGVLTYTYDFLNRLTAATGGISIIYDGDSNRVQETTSSGTTQFLVDDLNPTGYPQVVEEISGGVVQRTYTYGRELISQTQVGSATTSFYGDDGLGSVRFLSNASGTKSDSYDYDAFGNLLASSTPTPNNYRFAGEQNDPSLGLYYLRARYYNAGVGRFWSRDSAEVNPDDPRELNRYVYVADNPVNATDPTGNEGFIDYGENLANDEEPEEAAAAAGEADTVAQTRIVADDFLQPHAKQLWKATVRRIEGTPHVVVGEAQYTVEGETHTIIGANDFFSQEEANKSAEGILDLWRYTQQQGADFIGGGFNPTGPRSAAHFEELLRDEIAARNLPHGTRVAAGVSYPICGGCQALGTMLDNDTLLIELANDVKIVIVGR
jgi:RHS repeat-associated protein